jgi:hypothetical protein
VGGRFNDSSLKGSSFFRNSLRARRLEPLVRGSNLSRFFFVDFAHLNKKNHQNRSKNDNKRLKNREVSLNSAQNMAKWVVPASF